MIFTISHLLFITSGWKEALTVKFADSGQKKKNPPKPWVDRGDPSVCVRLDIKTAHGSLYITTQIQHCIFTLLHCSVDSRWRDWGILPPFID